MDTERLLKDLSYDFYKHVQEADRPEEENLTFSDIFPEISRTKRSYLANERLYSHQLRTVKALKSGKNVILISGSGSGKTEAWFLYSKDGNKTMVIYPTLALANDRSEEHTSELQSR